ncbi:MAG TPA: CsbD family protein [Pseudonocardia sp.]|jgi:uncharacterized protein YjbJ (UPF0337 family)|nr:CsbD family protein [Pseudonocardia sp.]
MGIADKMSHGARRVRGRTKRIAGEVTGDAGLEAEGRAEEMLGRLGRADEKVKDAFRGRFRTGRRLP